VPTHRLLLIRHGQAADAPVDRDRPLTAHGTRAAAAIGAWLQRAGYLPDRVFVSTALRAQQTWAGAAEALGDDREPTVDQRIYDNTVEAVLEVIGDVAADVGTVLVVVGHNPSMGELAFSLDDGSGSDSARRALHAGFPTGAVAVFRVETSFADLGPGRATLEYCTVPGA
jgi:phosphohistidine phosphatase